MSSNNTESAAVDSVTSVQNTSIQQDKELTSPKVEMSTGQNDTAGASIHAHGSVSPSSSSSDRPPPGPVRTDTTTALAQALAPPAATPPPILPVTDQRARSQSTAIGPSTDQPLPSVKDEEQTGPRLDLTLLLTNGARHPFILDADYLAKRNVDAQGNDPFNLSVYKLKELILREWRPEWEQKPSSPNYIRLISFGKLLDDKSSLKDLKFNRTERNVVHMTIKPQDFVDEDDGKGAKAGFSSGRAGNEDRSPGCRCVIM